VQQGHMVADTDRSISSPITIDWGGLCIGLPLAIKRTISRTKQDVLMNYALAPRENCPYTADKAK